jgi:hypothetical protein
MRCLSLDHALGVSMYISIRTSVGARHANVLSEICTNGNKQEA